MAKLDPQKKKINKLQDQVANLSETVTTLLQQLQCAASAAGWKVPDGPWNYNPMIAWEVKAKVEELFNPEKEKKKG